ncbi:PAS domain S-box protein [Pontibacter harenae]|uniref:PAS domain S-box protein n=1 Tax=Pontibacter harenae TaxID=2894083 RepID=UPI001E28F41D|nr:PAS domain S-box protein [Pontibacter harenae]MCC9166271.1 PAS domain S-box protein [Pontibacter harenae]
MINCSLDMICTIDCSGYFTYVSAASKRILGYDSVEMIGRNFLDFVVPEDRVRTREMAHKILSGLETTIFENSYIHKLGHVVPVLWSSAWSEEDGVVFCTGRDVTEQKALLQERDERENIFQALIEHGEDMLALVDLEGHYTYSGGAALRALGYKPEELVGINALDHIHPEDVPRLTEAVALILNSDGHVSKQEYRYKNSFGEWRWLETVLSNQMGNPAIKSLVASSRDITERKHHAQQLQESEQRFRSLFEDNPDAVFIENKEGIVLDVNCAAESLVGLPKADIVNCPLVAFVPAEVGAVCLEQLQLAFEGQTVKFEMELRHEVEGEKVLDITKVPVKVNGAVVAVYSIVKDVTVVAKYHKDVEEHARKLNTVLESITDAFCTIDKNWNYTYVNSEYEKLTQSSRYYYLGKSYFEMHPDFLNSVFYKQYLFAMETGKSLDFEAYSQEVDLWLSVKVFPSEEGLSIYLNDITEKVKTQQELEKLSLVASKITSGVMITDADGVTDWVNEGFTNLTGYGFSEVVGKYPGSFLHGLETDSETAQRIVAKRKQGKPFSEEILNYTRSGDKLWLLLDFTPVLDDDGKVSKFVIIQTDITEKVEAKQELQKLSLVASNTTNGVLITGADRRIEWANKGFTNLTGYSLEEAVGKRASELLHNSKTDATAFELVKDKMIQGEPVSFEILNYTKNGDEVWMSVQVNPIHDERGKLVNYVTTQTDITAIKKSELKLSQLTRDLYKQNRDLLQFTYIVSHNLRAPVANALGLTNLLTRVDRNSEIFEQFLEKLKFSVSRLDTILKDLNTILTIRDSKDTLYQEKVDLWVKCNQVMESLQESLKACGGEVQMDINEGTYVQGNEAFLYSVVYNLLSNAIKYRSPERPLQICIKSYGSTGLGTFISFSDNGCGFDISRVGKDVFKLYKRFHVHTEGKGIGLFLTKMHLEAMGGYISVNSQVNVGTRFLVLLK